MTKLVEEMLDVTDFYKIQNIFVKEKESKTKKRTKEEEIEKEGRRSG